MYIENAALGTARIGNRTIVHMSRRKRVGIARLVGGALASYLAGHDGAYAGSFLDLQFCTTKPGLLYMQCSVIINVT